jgi:hypothetical protein
MTLKFDDSLAIRDEVKRLRADNADLRYALWKILPDVNVVDGRLLDIYQHATGEAS